VLTHPLYRPPNHTRQTLAVTLYVPHFIVHKGSSATVCLHLAFCCFFYVWRRRTVIKKLTAYNADVQKYMQSNKLYSQKKRRKS